MSDLSLGEVEALVAKAARGAGLPWGLAAEAGKAARRAFASGGSRAEDAFLAWFAEGPGREGCPLIAGLRDRDLGCADLQRADPVYRAVVDEAAPGGERRAPLSEAGLTRLTMLAHNTYAPATEESRAKGAG